MEAAEDLAEVVAEALEDVAVVDLEEVVEVSTRDLLIPLWRLACLLMLAKERLSASCPMTRYQYTLKPALFGLVFAFHA